MATHQPTRNHSFRLGHALAVVSIALALAVGAFGAGAAASLGANNVFSRSSSSEPASLVEPLGSPISPSSSPASPTTVIVE